MSNNTFYNQMNNKRFYFINLKGVPKKSKGKFCLKSSECLSNKCNFGFYCA